MKKLDLVGQEFGNLTVLERLPKQKIKCQCTCGNVKDYYMTNVIYKNHTRSCGCLLKRIISGELKHKKIKSIGSSLIIYDWWKSFLKTSARRNISVNVTPKDLENLFIKQKSRCAITGIEIKLPKNSIERRTGFWSASLDRIDNEKGYSIDNVQWVHKTINLMRNSLSIKNFLTLCYLVTKKNKTKNNKKDIDDFLIQLSITKLNKGKSKSFSC